MPASLTNQVRLGFSMGWRIWTPNEVGFYAKTLAHTYFILIILKSKFLKNKLWVVNYNLFIGIRKYYVFIEFLKFGMKSKEERSYWKKIIYVSLLVRHASFTKQSKVFRSKRGFRIKAIKRYIKLNIKKYKRRRKWKTYKKNKIIKKVIKTYKKNTLKSLKFISKNLTNSVDFNKIKILNLNINFNNKYKKKITTKIFKNFLFKISGQKLSLKNNIRFKKNFKKFKLKIKKFKKFKIKKLKNKVPTTQIKGVIKNTKSGFLFLKKKIKYVNNIKNKLLFNLKKNNKTKQCALLKKKLLLTNYCKFLKFRNTKLFKKLKINRYSYKIKKKTIKLLQLHLKKTKIKLIKNNNNFLLKKNLKNFRYLKNMFLYKNLKLIKDMKYSFYNNIEYSYFKKNQSIKKQNKGNYRFGIFKNTKKQYNLKIPVLGNKNITKFENMRYEVVFEKFKSRAYPTPRIYSISGGPRKRLSRNLKRSFKGKYIKYVIGLIWFWEKIARLVSYYVGYSRTLERFDLILN